jgi:4'-phosphopantetheinyl transferase
MRSEASDWVSGMLAAKACDWTPKAAPPSVRVLFAPVAHGVQASQHWAAVLSDAEVLRAGRFVTDAGRAQFTQRRAFRRYCGALALGCSRPLEQIDFRETEKGCPYLPEAPDLWFSFSSCRLGFLGAWSSTHAIGVDIEDRRRHLEAVELAQCYFRKAEAEAVAGADAAARWPLFLKLWTLKEAALKSIGEGLPFGLDAFAFELAPTPRMVQAPAVDGGATRFNAHVIEGAETVAALVCCSHAGQITLT